MKIYLIIPNVLLLSSGLNGQKTPNKNAKIIIGLGVPKLMHKTTINFPLEFSETKGSEPCEYSMFNNHLSVTSANDIVSVKTAKQPNTMVSRQLLTLCDQI